MPFDTTHFFIGGQKFTEWQVIIPGGKDTTIYLTQGQLPSHIDTRFANADSAVKQIYEAAYQFEPEKIKEQEHYSPDATFIFTFIIVMVVIFLKAWRSSRSTRTYSEGVFYNESKPAASRSLTYYGDELNFSNAQLITILTKRFAYYNALSADEKIIFIKRLQKFVADKTFKIHGEKGYKEMPVLISAAAIQLSFGLKKYLLPHFKFIHIHPQEFLRVKPILCFLEGNVSGHSINLSWKHFLDGYANPKDGQNVGLHELAHALYYQTFEADKNVDKNFSNFYTDFNVDGNKAYHTEKTVAGGLYSAYAEKNFQEFWAESVEIFFEKPVEMHSHYPQLYQTMKSLLNQDPVTKAHLMRG